MERMTPELIAQLVDPRDQALSAGASTKVLWQCPDDPRHRWSASPKTRKRSPGCPVCLNKLVLPGVNDLATTDPDLASHLADPDVGHAVHRGSHRSVTWTCPVSDKHRWDAQVVSRTRLGAGCPFCSGRLPVPGETDLKTTHPELASQLVDPSQAVTVGPGSSKALMWTCPADPTHEPWSAPVRNRTGQGRKKPTTCPSCAGRAGRGGKRNQTLGELDSPLLAEAVDPDYAATLSTGSGRVILWRCDTCPGGREYPMAVKNRVRGQGCGVCAGTEVLAGHNDLATTHPELAAQLVDQTLATTISRGSMLITSWRCEHGHTWPAAVYARVAGNGCPECSPVGSSYGEQVVLDVVRVFDPTARHRVRLQEQQGSGHGIEVDILTGTLAIEFNGVFWHSEAAGRGKNSHKDKLDALRQAGYQPLTIWEDDWADPIRRRVIIRTLAHRLHRTDRLHEALVAAGLEPGDTALETQRIGARVLTVGEVSGKIAQQFFRDNHVQGPVALTRAFALFDQDFQPRAVLGVRSAKHNSRAARKDGIWEIQRYATFGVVQGGFSRLLAHATSALSNSDDPIRGWATLSADESSDGELYRAAGFTPEAKIPPSYWYAGGTIRGRRAPKENYQLRRFRTDDSLVYEEGWTELEAAAANKLYRVWDAGKTRWVKPV